jgi:DNA-binding NarL/FixJ family response regulator
MHSVTRSAKGWLVQSTRSSFYDVIREAKLSPRQTQIVELRFVDGLMNYQIAYAAQRICENGGERLALYLPRGEQSFKFE